MKRVLLTGSNGMLGSSLAPTLFDNGYKIFPTDLITDDGCRYLDVRYYKQIIDMIEEVKPDIIMHLAAETDVDECERNPDHAYMTNTIGTQNIVYQCYLKDIPLVYISTIGVFSGESHEPYTEFDTAVPANVYGRSKLEGERIVQGLLTKYFIIRAGWMVGGGREKDKKFVGKIIKQLQNCNEIQAVIDKIGSPTFTKDFSENLVKIVESNYYGLYHCTNKGYCSRYDVAKEIVKLLGKDAYVEPVSSAYFPLSAPRARSEMSRNYKLDLLGMNNMRDWKIALQEYLEEW
jgi:dTDP-4-dehydrorhamnose reductase